MNLEELKSFAHSAQSMIDANAVEDKLRHFFSLKLAGIFPDSPWWIRAHVEGTEAHVRFSADCRDRDGYADAVVGKTAIEYERNLANQSIFAEGYHQVKEYCAALYNLGIPENEILGVLSDTVRWYGYSVRVIKEAGSGCLYGPDHIELTQLSFVDLSLESDEEFQRFEVFVKRFLDRNQSRLLNANTLVMDFGMDSDFYARSIAEFRNIVERAMREKPEYAALIRQVWQNFVAYLGLSDYSVFSMDTYINEFYLVTVAKMICVDILAGEPVISDRETIKSILDGRYFKKQNIYNLVDYDYFGWLNCAPYADLLLECASEMQNRLAAYDFSHIGDQDIFGWLLAQLADQEHRLMLGQEFTPHWIARDMVNHNLDRLSGEKPQILDMCCGSGVFLIESVRAVRERFEINIDTYTPEKDSIVFSCVMGFDIDPLAVMLAKVNWVMAMRDLFPVHTGGIMIPVYHADSLFAATPITHKMPEEGNESYVLSFDGREISLPAFLLTAEHRKTFDSFISVIYQMAMTRAGAEEKPLEKSDAADMITAVLENSGSELTSEDKEALMESAGNLTAELERLQRAGRNGIWYFILSNSYRPGLTEKQFNCILSNPPWMAMSKLADNPYKKTVGRLAKKYGINPAGAAHPHVELATIFLLNSVDRYLKEGGLWSCIMPGSLMSGLNHEPFRCGGFRASSSGQKTQITALWELPQNTFKNKGIVLSGAKSGQKTPDTLQGRVYSGVRKYESCEYTLNHQGRRSAWTNRGQDAGLMEMLGEATWKFMEGCDLFPRTVLFHDFRKRADGNWDIRPIERTSGLWYLINDIKKECCNDLRADAFDQKYIFDAYISKHLSPFYLAAPAKVLMPGQKIRGEWKALTPADRALMNAGTAYCFEEIERKNGKELGTYLLSVINIYGKLMRQDFSHKQWLVLSSAGGSNPCAAYISLDEIDRSRIIIDQTLYWYLTDSEEEAVYITGLLNSDALSDIIKDFQPEGGFGKRHIHTIPYKIIPAFDPEDPLHMEMAAKTRALMGEWAGRCREDLFARLLEPDSGALPTRRKRQQTEIRRLSAYGEYEAACQGILC